MTTSTPDLAPQDFLSTYPLPDGVDAMISTSAEPGEPGIHWVARGLLVETSARLLARPVSLDFIEREHITFISATVSMASTVLSSNPGDVLVAVDLMLERRSGRWVLVFRDRIIATGPCLPSPGHLAELAAAEYDRGRQPLDVCRAPIESYKNLW